MFGGSILTDRQVLSGFSFDEVPCQAETRRDAPYLDMISGGHSKGTLAGFIMVAEVQIL